MTPAAGYQIVAHTPEDAPAACPTHGTSWIVTFTENSDGSTRNYCLHCAPAERRALPSLFDLEASA